MSYRSFNSNKALPKIVFVDTSFLFDLIKYTKDSGNRDLVEGFEFYEKLCTNDTILWISPLIVEESIWKLLRDEIYEEMNNSGISGISISNLKKNNLRIYKKGYERGRTKATDFISFIKAAGFTVSYTSPFKSMNNKIRSDLVVKYSIGIINNYYLESADAFHIATARCNGIDWIISNDLAFQDIPNIGIYGIKQKV